MKWIMRTTRTTQVDDGNEVPVETLGERRVVRLVPEEEDCGATTKPAGL